MDPCLQELLQLVTPPSEPQNAKGDWKRLESDLGLTLPSDYKQYIEEYGGGVLCTLFEIQSPFGLEAHYKSSIKDAWRSWAGIYHGWGDVPESELPFPIYPKVPGLLPWGTYGDVDVLGWLTDPDTSQWHIVYQDQHEGFFELPYSGFVRFLVSALKGETPLPDRAMGEHIMKAPRTFVPF
jgi:hypothetical protein